jgi:hypothetical protein
VRSPMLLSSSMASEAYQQPLPRHVVKEFEKCLRCGVLAWGYARAYVLRPTRDGPRPRQLGRDTTTPHRGGAAQVHRPGKRENRLRYPGLVRTDFLARLAMRPTYAWHRSLRRTWLAKRLRSDVETIAPPQGAGPPPGDAQWSDGFGARGRRRLRGLHDHERHQPEDDEFEPGGGRGEAKPRA